MRISVLADDLTGANVVAALLTKEGWSVDVHLNVGELAHSSSPSTMSDVHVWNTGTRNASSDVAKSVFASSA